MADPVAVKRALARLAASPNRDRTVVERAVAARGDVALAAAFVESVGLPRLRRAVACGPAGEGREGCDPGDEGRAALRAFERYRAAARGDHFRPGHATDLGSDTKRGGR
ncbi:hypothetical protein ACFQPA_07165 [Halomarina halobia]|uniref:Uncharacterized protein n=1 Tax=Halomarina halobia TaxID=3033386 RepID=A0ABD6AD05_9EURY|nr:hypothetical protein [Halomarina sp. PSR21]